MGTSQKKEPNVSGTEKELTPDQTLGLVSLSLMQKLSQKDPSFSWLEEDKIEKINLKNPKYPNGEFESIFWVKEANCVYGKLSQSQLSKLGSRGKAAKIMAPYLKKEIGLN